MSIYDKITFTAFILGSTLGALACVIGIATISHKMGQIIALCILAVGVSGMGIGLLGLLITILKDIWGN